VYLPLFQAGTTNPTATLMLYNFKSNITTTLKAPSAFTDTLPPRLANSYDRTRCMDL